MHRKKQLHHYEKHKGGNDAVGVKTRYCVSDVFAEDTAGQAAAFPAKSGNG